MANGFANDTAPWKIILTTLTFAIAGFTIAGQVLEDRDRPKITHEDLDRIRDEIHVLRKEMRDGTDSRYRETDAKRDFSLVEFRFKRNEENIQQCLEHIKDHD